MAGEPLLRLENLSTHAPQLVITDMRMDKVGGLDILRECKEVLPQTPVILITAYKTVETALEAMKLGAYDYITKPFKVDELQLTIQDDGRGMDVGAASRGLGLLGATERAAAVGGELTVESTLGNGVRLTLRIPLPAAS